MSGVIITALNASAVVSVPNKNTNKTHFDSFKTFAQSAEAAKKEGNYDKLADAVGKFRGKDLGTFERFGFKNGLAPDYMNGKQQLPDLLRDLNKRSGKPEADLKAISGHIDTFEKELKANDGDLGKTLMSLETQIEKSASEAPDTQDSSSINNPAKETLAFSMPGAGVQQREEPEVA